MGSRQNFKRVIFGSDQRDKQFNESASIRHAPGPGRLGSRRRGGL